MANKSHLFHNSTEKYWQKSNDKNASGERTVEINKRKIIHEVAIGISVCQLQSFFFGLQRKIKRKSVITLYVRCILVCVLVH